MSKQFDPEADFQKAGALAKEAGRRVADLRAALDHAEAHPLDIPDADEYATAVAKMRHALARAAEEANHANAAKDAAGAALAAHRTKKAKASEAPAADAHDAALEALASAVLAAAASLSEPLALAASTRAARDAIRAELRESGEPVGKDARTSMASSWPALVDPRPGALGALATAVRVIEWMEGAEAREAEEREFLRRKEIERKRDALSGRYGREAKEAAEAEARAELRAAYAARGGGAFGAAAARSPAALEVEVYRRSAGLDAPRGE